MNRTKVDLDYKDDLVLRKHIRQSTTKILKRPSDFQGSVVSPGVLTALLKQRSEGRLENSALQTWVQRFEREFDESQNKNSTEFSEDYIEKQFQALHKELTRTSETSKGKNSQDVRTSKRVEGTNSSTGLLDELIPHHQTLDSSPARHKITLSKKRNTSHPINNGVREEISSAKLGSRVQVSNLTRDSITKFSVDETSKPKEFNDFQLGKEPDILHGQDERKRQEKTNLSISRYFVQKITDSLEGRKQEKNSKPKENEYEEIPVYSQVKPPRKNKSRAPKPPSDAYEDISMDLPEKTVRPSSPEPCVETDLVDIDSIDLNIKRKEKKTSGPVAPFERFQNCLFSTFTACTPWCVMKKVYWKRDTQSEEIFSVMARRNSRMRQKTRNSRVQ